MTEMDGRDREPYPRGEERPPRLRSSSTSQGRRGPTSGFGRFDDDLELSDDPPSWEDRFGSARERAARPEQSPERARERRPLRPLDSPSPFSSSSRRGQPSRSFADDLVEERSSDLVADPYDRLRRVSERRSRQVQPDLVDLDLDEEAAAPVRHRADRRPRIVDSPPRPARSARPTLSQPQLLAVGSLLARSSQDAGALAKLTSAAVVSLLALSVVTLARVGSVDDWIVVRLDAAGEPTRWASNETLWRVPMLVVFATLAGLLVAWRLRRHDAFAAQFTIVAVLLLHGLGWVAAGRLLF